MILYHFSDSHTCHNLLNIPEQDIDIIIFSGDESNSRDAYKNEGEAREFFTWFSNLTVKYKIFVAGNHSTAIAKGLITKKDIRDMDIIYLENDWVIIGGLKIWGSPYSPTFGEWSFMKARHKMQKLWDHIEPDTDILITHTPPKGVLDLSYNRQGEIERCGCKSLLNKVIEVKPKLHLFGHLHNCEDIINAGVTKLSNYPTVFSNGSIVTDGKFGVLTSHGNLFEVTQEGVNIL